MAIFRYKEQPGNYYAYLIEGHGDDANDGLTPETAVATLDRLVEILDTYAGAYRRHAVIVKKRIYNEGITYVRNASKPITFEFVGGCEIDGSGGVRPIFPVVGDHFYFAYFLDYGSVSINQGSAYYGNNIKLYNCTIKNSWFNQSGGTAGTLNLYQFYNCVFVLQNMSHNPTFTATYFNFYNCVLISCSTPSSTNCIRIENITNTILFNCINFYYRTIGTPSFDYCCVFTTIKLYGNIGDYSQTDLIAEQININGIGANPQFTDPTNGQYTVNQSSPCLYRGENGQHIGIGEGISLSAVYIYSNAEVIDNFEVKNQKLIRVNDASDGLLETYILNLGGTRSVMSLDLAANLGFLVTSLLKSLVIYSEGYIKYDSLANYHTGASVTDGGIKYRSLEDNNLGNTPTSSPLYWKRMTWDAVSYPAGEIKQYTDGKWYKSNTITSTSWVPGEWDQVVIGDFLTFQMKFGRTFDLAQASPWVNFPFNMLLEVDSMGRGSMDDDFDLSTAATIRFNYYKLRIHAKTIR